jgi:hypothetical protein
MIQEPDRTKSRATEIQINENIKQSRKGHGGIKKRTE